MVNGCGPDARMWSADARIFGNGLFSGFRDFNGFLVLDVLMALLMIAGVEYRISILYSLLSNH
jgi:hypothetical protein